MDHVGNSHMHGLPDDDRDWMLTDTEIKQSKKNAVPPPRVCGKCFGCSRAGSQKCSLCGEPFPVEAREVVEVDGELAEIEVERQRRAMWAERSQAKDLESLTELGIKKYGPIRGPRWANYVYQGRIKKRERMSA